MEAVLPLWTLISISLLFSITGLLTGLDGISVWFWLAYFPLWLKLLNFFFIHLLTFEHLLRIVYASYLIMLFIIFRTEPRAFTLQYKPVLWEIFVFCFMRQDLIWKVLFVDSCYYSLCYFVTIKVLGAVPRFLIDIKLTFVQSEIHFPFEYNKYM